MRRAAEDAVNQAWLERVASEMLADAEQPAIRPPAPSAVRCAVHEDRPVRHQHRAQQRKAKAARDGYGRPLRTAPVPPPPAAQDDGRDARRETPRTGHPLGIAGKVLLGAALTGVGMGLTTGVAAAGPAPNDTTPSTSDPRVAPVGDVRSMTDRELGQELGRVSGKDYLRTQEVVTELKLRGTQFFEAAPPTDGVGVTGAAPVRPGVPVTGTLPSGPTNGGGVTRAGTPSAPQVAGIAPQPDRASSGPADQQSAESPKTTLKIVVVGDSFTSGEGADSSTYRRVLVPTTTEDGITYQTYQIDPAHQSSTAPTLQALNQIQAANPGADLQVSFVPVSGATRGSLYQTSNPGTPFEQPPQINAVKGADVVIVGIGGNDARFSDWVRTALFSTDSSSAQQFPQFAQQFNDGTYLANQTKLLNDLSDLAAPTATIVSLGYPKSLPATVPGTPTWSSPFSWSTISQGEADRSNELATTLNTNNQAASAIAASQHPAQQWLFADVSTALQGRELLTPQEGLNGLTPSNLQGSYHPNDLGQQLLGSALQPYVEQAVNGQLARFGVQGAENVAPVTPTFSQQWNLRVDVPLQTQAQSANQPPANQPDGTGTTPAQPEAAQPSVPGQPGATEPDGTQPAAPADTPTAPVDAPAAQGDAPAASAPASPQEPAVTPDPAPGTDPNADPDQDGIPNGQDPTWNENNTDPTSTDVGDGPEGNPGYTSSTGTESGYSDSGFGDNTGNADTGSGNFSGSLDTGSGAVSGSSDTSSGYSDIGSGSSDTSSGYSDSGFGDNGGDVSGGYSDSGSGSSGGFDSSSAGSLDTGSTSGFDSGGYDSGGFGGDAGF